MKVFSIFDKKAQAFSNPFYSPSRPVAVRNFTSEVRRQDVNNVLYLYPDDFALYELASFDESTGLFTDDKPSFVVEAQDVYA